MKNKKNKQTNNWKVPRGKRELVVTHEILPSRKHRWSAVSIGDTKFKRIAKGGSQGEVAGAVAKKGLKDFFKLPPSR
jgi:hypothetical protein